LDTLKKFRCATLNVATYGSKEEEIVRMMERRKIDMLGMAEMRVRGVEEGRDIGGGYVLMYKGVEEGFRKHGVGFVVGPRLSPHIVKVEGITERLIVCSLKIGRKKYHVFQVYAPQQGHTEEEKEEFMELMERWVGLKQEEDNVCLLIGDFNARVGKRRSEVEEEVVGGFGEEERNVEGERLLDFCMRKNLKVMNTFFEHRMAHIYTRYRWNNNTGEFDQKSVIDYIISSDKRIILNAKVMPGESMDSDHRLLVADMRIRLEKKNVLEKRKLIKIDSLKEQNKRNAYRNSVRKKIGRMNREEVFMGLQEKVVEAAGEELGYRYVGGTKKRHTKWWNDEVERAIKMKTTKMRSWLKRRTVQSRHEYVEARNRAEIVKRKAKKEAAKKIAEELKEDVGGSRKKIFRITRTYKTKKKERQSNIKDREGETLIEMEEINRRWSQYFEELLNGEGAEEEEDEREEEVEEVGAEREEDEITVEELETSMKGMKNDKAPGEDGLVVELLREGGVELHEKVLELLNECWRRKEVPENWGKTIIIPIYKQKGDTGECKNYRGISIMDHIAKLYERVLERRLRESIEPQLGEEQYGYRKGRSTTDLMFALRQIGEKIYEYNRRAYVVFVDLRKAFDTVPRKRLWEVLEEGYGVSRGLCKALESMYKVTKCNVRTGYKNDRWFEVGKGVKQGSVLSPLLFIAYMDKIIDEVREEMGNLGGDIMAYADDLALWCENREGIERIVSNLTEKLRERGLQVNTEKTEVMIIGREREEGEEEWEFVVDGKILKKVKEVKYLGGVYTEDGGNDAEISHRIAQVGRAAGAVYPLLKDQHMGLEVKRIIYENVLLPIMMYGAETWSITRRQESRIQATEMRILRAIIGKTRRDRIRNERVRQEVRVAPVMRRIEAARLRWWGHLERMQENRIAKRRWNWTPNGRRPRGRPRKKWKESVQDTLKRWEMPTMEEVQRRRVWEDRDGWKRLLSPLTGRGFLEDRDLPGGGQ